MNYIAERTFLSHVFAAYVSCLCTVRCLGFLQGFGSWRCRRLLPLARIMGRFVDILLVDKDDGS